MKRMQDVLSGALLALITVALFTSSVVVASAAVAVATANVVVTLVQIRRDVSRREAVGK